MPTALVGNLNNAILLLPSNYAWTGTNLTYHFAATLPAGYANQWTGLYDTAGNRLNYTVGTFEAWASDKQADAVSSLNEVAGFTNISFSSSSAGAAMTFGALSPQAYRTSAGAGGEKQDGAGYYPNDPNPYRGDVWLFGDINNDPAVTSASYWQQVIPHEIGHAVGLRHPHEVGLSQLYSNFSVMSYDFTLREQLFTREYQLYDIAALQYRYGFDASTNDGITTYSTHDEILPGETFARARYYSIWDESGLDILTAGNTGGWGAYIDLRPGHFSSVGADSRVRILNGSRDDPNNDFGVQNVSIAFGTLIEDATGSANADVIIGNALSNDLRGGAGNDVIYADGYNISNQEADYRRVDKGAFLSLDYDPFAQLDNLYGDAGDDTLFGSTGSDWMYGGIGNDTASYALETGEVTLRYDGRSAEPWISVPGSPAGEDALFEIEKVVLTNYDDSLEVFGRVTTNITVDGAAGVDDAVDADPGATQLIIYTDAAGNGYIRNADGTGGEITLVNFRPNMSSSLTGSAVSSEIAADNGHPNFVEAGVGDDLTRTGDREALRSDTIGDSDWVDTIDLTALGGVDRSHATISRDRVFVENVEDDIAIAVESGFVTWEDVAFAESAAVSRFSADRELAMCVIA